MLRFERTQRGELMVNTGVYINMKHLVRARRCCIRSETGKARLNESSVGMMKTAARLLGVSADALVHCLTAREVTAGTTHVTIFL